LNFGGAYREAAAIPSLSFLDRIANYIQFNGCSKRTSNYRPVMTEDSGHGGALGVFFVVAAVALSNAVTWPMRAPPKNQ
jgi:hypothetical protein